SVDDYQMFLQIIQNQDSHTTLEQRKYLATRAFADSSHYDSAIFNYFNQTENQSGLKISETDGRELRYGENPHQQGYFFGDFKAMFEQLHGKELSYNNLLDVDAAVNLMNEFKNEAPTFAILKHNNACGLAQKSTMKEAYLAALAGDPVSAFGGVLIANGTIDEDTANEINQLFCEVVIAPKFTAEAQTILKEKKDRILLVLKDVDLPKTQVRSCLNGYLVQDRDTKTDVVEDLTTVTTIAPNSAQIADLLFASKISKHTKSNTIVLAKGLQLCASGTGQTSRVDALR